MTLSTVVLFLGPRAAMGALWLTTDYVDDAFERPVWPALGLAFLPSATILYVLLWTEGGGARGVGGAEWIIVAVGALVDLAVWVTRLLPERRV